MIRSLVRPGFNGMGIHKLPTTAIRTISFKPDFSKYKKINQPPGLIVGTVNEPTKIPLVSFYEGSYHWVYEKIITVSLIPLSLVPFLAGVEHPMIDSLFSIGLLFHTHAGLKSCIIDYIPERVWGFWHRFAGRLLTIGTFIAMYGVYVLETANNGLYDLISELWRA